MRVGLPETSDSPTSLMADAATLSRRAEDIHSRYRYQFGGKPRITRRLADLDNIVAASEALIEECRAAEADEVIQTVRERISLYLDERALIEEAHALGATAVQATMLGTRANAFFGYYARHFAGQSRLTRDLGLLDDVIDALREVKDALQSLLASNGAEIAERHLKTVEGNIEHYVSERDAILSVREAASPQELTSACAGVANAQFEAYRVHFAGRARVSRRPALIERLIANLEWALKGMNGLIAAGAEVEINTKNRQRVRERLDAYSREADAIRKAREDASVYDLIDSLGQEANLVMADYSNEFAGKNRATRELSKMTALLDRLVEVERQMSALGRVYENETNERNTSIVHDTLLVYSSEWQAIRDAQSN